MTRLRGRTPGSSALDAHRRSRELSALGDEPSVDVLVVGGGIVGAGIALDAAARGLRTLLIERGDLATGTSRWSSKLIHGGLRYLASGQVGIAHESAVERHLIMTRIAPHLTRPLAQVLPLHESSHPGLSYRGSSYRATGAFVGIGYGLGDALRRAAGTPTSLLPAPTALSAARTRALVPAVQAAGLRGGIRGWDGQVIDDARLVVAVARTAAGYGARVLTRVEALSVRADGCELRDVLTGERLAVRARAVISAAGVWAGQVDPSVRLRPSRGTHLVVDSARLGGSDVSLTVPLPGQPGRFVFTVPAIHGRTYIGLTDVAANEIVDEPQPSDDEIAQLLASVNAVLAEPLTRADVVGAFAGLRPLLVDTRHSADAPTADLSRRHAVLESDDGVLSVVGGKLTTYRRMAQDGVDEAVRRRLLPTARPSRTADLPLVGAWPRERSAEIAATPRLVRRYGAEAPFVASLPRGADAARGVTAQELEWAVRVEGALTVADVIDRRTRLGLVGADAAASLDAARAAFDRAGVEPIDTTGRIAH